MEFWVVLFFLNWGVLGAAAVGMTLHLRLVKFFDLGWSVWATASALITIYVALLTHSALLGIAVGGLTGLLLGVAEDGVILRRALQSFLPARTIERLSFVGALGMFLVLSSGVELLGYRDRIMAPASVSERDEVPELYIVTAVFCWTSLILIGVAKFTRQGVALRAVLDNRTAAITAGIKVNHLTVLIGAFAGWLTGTAAGSFGLLHYVNGASGLEIMLIVIIPSLIAGLRSSCSVLLSTGLFVIVMLSLRVWLGESLADLAIAATLLLTLLIFPRGVMSVDRRV